MTKLDRLYKEASGWSYTTSNCPICRIPFRKTECSHNQSSIQEWYTHKIVEETVKEQIRKLLDNLRQEEEELVGP